MTESISCKTIGQTEAQEALLGYWYSLCDGAVLPRRGCFDPGSVLRYLGGISILEIEDSGQVVCRVESRIVKSRLSSSDILGCRRFGLEALIVQNSPITGMRVLDDDVHHWLRLPLLNDRKDRLVVVCYDEFIRERSSDAGGVESKFGLSPQWSALAA
ncbi:MAG: PAS domain-containing protein [Pseudomonadota bacterium]